MLNIYLFLIFTDSSFIPTLHPSDPVYPCQQSYTLLIPTCIQPLHPIPDQQVSHLKPSLSSSPPEQNTTEQVYYLNLHTP